MFTSIYTEKELTATSSNSSSTWDLSSRSHSQATGWESHAREILGFTNNGEAQAPI
jgi:hypothetical protein